MYHSLLTNQERVNQLRLYKNKAANAQLGTMADGARCVYVSK